MDAPFLPDLLAASAYPHPCDGIECIETHISWVLLTGEYAYKIRKPVDFGFVDFSTAAKRRRDCDDEVRLNAAFAPEFYLDVVPICRGTDGRFAIEGEGETVEHAVKMRQFDRACELDVLIERGEVARAEFREFGLELAAIHAKLESFAFEDPVGRAWAPVAECLEELTGNPQLESYGAEVAAVEAWVRADHARRASLIEARARGGRVRECHGDLHLANMVRTEAGIRAFDCLEFNESLRRIDTMSDVAFLFMDCLVGGHGGHAYAFLDGYLESSADFEGALLLPFYAVYRSLVRAKVASLQLRQGLEDGVSAKLRRHVAWARGMVDRPCGDIVLMCGLSGSGKSYVAERLLGELGALRLRTDVLRRVSAPDDPERYAPEKIFDVYAEIAGHCAGLLATGETVLVDATFLTRERRELFYGLAESLGVRAVAVHCVAPLAVMEARIRARPTADPSEATVAVLHNQLTEFERPGLDENCVRVDTQAELDVAGLAADVRSALGRRSATPGRPAR